MNDDAYTKITKIIKNDNWVDIKPIINNTDKIEKRGGFSFNLEQDNS